MKAMVAGVHAGRIIPFLTICNHPLHQEGFMPSRGKWEFAGGGSRNFGHAGKAAARPEC
jgi:hypothetical protein